MYLLFRVYVSPEGRFDHTQAVYTEQCAAMWLCLVAGCNCTSRTLAPIHSPLGEPRHPPRTPGETNDNKTGQFKQQQHRKKLETV